MAQVSLSNAAKTYGPHTVFSNLDLDVRDGECFTLLGPSGCGKTVILRLIAGFEQPTAGVVSIGGETVSDPARKVAVPPEARRIGVVFQDYAVWPHRTVFENVSYPLMIQNVARTELTERVRQAIEQVNLGGLSDRLPGQLSGGQQQRVALARALVSRPRVMLLDEPLCNLDANLREEMRFEIKELQRTTGVTILYVTHDQEIALAISDRMAVMDRTGTIRQTGTPEDIFERPADPFVFSFMGVSNFIPVRLEGGRAVLPGQDGPLDLAGNAATPPPGPDARFLACRPSDLEPVARGAHLTGRVTRVHLLGAEIDLRVELGGHEVRVRQDTRQALEQGLHFTEGQECGLALHAAHWFTESVNGEARP
jgi:iron(III) transport system ATP-binding protein